jgi:hypothetical protein
MKNIIWNEILSDMIHNMTWNEMKWNEILSDVNNSLIWIIIWCESQYNMKHGPIWNIF